MKIEPLHFEAVTMPIEAWHQQMTAIVGADQAAEMIGAILGRYSVDYLDASESAGTVTLEVGELSESEAA